MGAWRAGGAVRGRWPGRRGATPAGEVGAEPRSRFGGGEEEMGTSVTATEKTCHRVRVLISLTREKEDRRGHAAEHGRTTDGRAPHRR